jgi:hypothetical protein
MRCRERAHWRTTGAQNLRRWWERPDTSPQALAEQAPPELRKPLIFEAFTKLK